MSWSRETPAPGGCVSDGLHVALGFCAVFAMHILTALAFGLGASIDPTESIPWIMGIWGMGLGCTQIVYVLPIAIAAGLVRRQWAIGMALGALATAGLQVVNYALCGAALVAAVSLIGPSRHEPPSIPPTRFDVEPDGELLIDAGYLDADSETSMTGETLWSSQGFSISEDDLCAPGGLCPILPPLFEISSFNGSLQVVGLDGEEVTGSWYGDDFYTFEPSEIAGDPPQAGDCEGQSSLYVPFIPNDWSEISGAVIHRWPADCTFDGVLLGGELAIRQPFKAYPRDPLPPADP